MSTPNRKNVAVLISGRGSNMQALVHAAINPAYPATIALVLSNRPDVAGLEFAQKSGIDAVCIDHKKFESRREHEDQVQKVLMSHNIDLVCLAGYMRILSEEFLLQWRGKMLNIHPSLLPSFRGLDTHARALERGVRVHGCSVHFVDGELDSGPIVAQAVVPVELDDDEASLSARVLEAEHLLFPRALDLVASGRVRETGSDVVLSKDVRLDQVLLFPAKAKTES